MFQSGVDLIESSYYCLDSHQVQLLSRYEDLKHQLEIAQEAAHEEDEEAELARATAAVARLTAPAAINDADIRLAEELTDVASNSSYSRRQDRPKVCHKTPRNVSADFPHITVLHAVCLAFAYMPGFG